jgi:maltooligosyltrehalose trehalohydrolase
MELVLGQDETTKALPMQEVGDGYFELRLPHIAEGTRYGFRSNAGAKLLPDPASRWQPDGVHQPSAVYFPEDFSWGDGAWRGLAMRDLAIYELHVGAFTPDGTFDGIVPRLAELADLGVTALEIMPVSQFPGMRNWGYDGVHAYAAQNSYGGPQALQRLVDAAHATGLGVLLDVVYNHFGPEGNYLGQFGGYFGDRYVTPWGSALNYDGPDSDHVRRFMIDSAVMWIRDFHIDGLRLDAVQTIFDWSAYHFLAELQAAVQQAAAEAGRSVVVIAETNQNDGRIVASAEQWGYGLDGAWSDDFHHSVHAALTGERDGYYADFGSPADVAKAINDSFVYDGAYSRYHRRRHGNVPEGIPRERFVACIQNHDQIGNRPLGDRLAKLLSPEALRLAAGLLLIGADTPLMFMGEEYGETNGFPFFCSYGDPMLIESVREGRKREFAELAFDWGGSIPDANEASTFGSARLSWRWEDDPLRSGLRRLYRTLLRARRTCPALQDRQHTSARLLTAAGQPLLLVERGANSPLRAVASFSGERVDLDEVDLPEGMRGVAPLLSTAEVRFGGDRDAGQPLGRLRPFELLLWGDAQWTMFAS